MAYIRKLPSGLWQATVRMPNGKRISETDRLKSVVKEWATRQEAAFKSGDHRDPRDGKIKIGDWRERVSMNRAIEPTTRAKLDSIWRTHCEEQWESWPMSSVTRMEAQAWINRLRTTRRARHQGRAVKKSNADEVPLLGAATIHECANTMSKLYALAMMETPPLVITNPFTGLDLPTIERHQVQFYEHAAADRLFAAVERKSGKQWRTADELGMHVGLRPGEIFGLHGSRIDWTRRLLYVHPGHDQVRAP